MQPVSCSFNPKAVCTPSVRWEMIHWALNINPHEPSSSSATSKLSPSLPLHLAILLLMPLPSRTKGPLGRKMGIVSYSTQPGQAFPPAYGDLTVRAGCSWKATITGQSCPCSSVHKAHASSHWGILSSCTMPTTVQALQNTPSQICILMSCLIP